MASTEASTMEPISKLVNIMMEGGDIDPDTLNRLIKQVQAAKENFPRKKPTKQVVASCGILDEKEKIVRIEDHPQYKPYFDIKKNGLTSDATIKAHMEEEGLNPDLIDREGLQVRIPATQYVGAPREYEGIIERILEKNSQRDQGEEGDEDYRPEWSRTFVWNTETEQYHQCMPVSMFQEIKQFESEQPASKPTAFEGMDEIYHFLLDIRAKMMEEQRTLGVGPAGARRLQRLPRQGRQPRPRAQPGVRRQRGIFLHKSASTSARPPRPGSSATRTATTMDAKGACSCQTWPTSTRYWMETPKRHGTS